MISSPVVLLVVSFSTLSLCSFRLVYNYIDASYPACHHAPLSSKQSSFSDEKHNCSCRKDPNQDGHGSKPLKQDCSLIPNELLYNYTFDQKHNRFHPLDRFIFELYELSFLFEEESTERPIKSPRLYYSGKRERDRLKYQYQTSKTKNDITGIYDSNIDNEFPHFISKGSEAEKLWRQRKTSGYLKRDIDLVAMESSFEDVIANSDVDLLSEIIEDNIDAVHKKSEQGWQPIHKAAYAGKKGVVEVLVNNGADVNAHNNIGATPLWYASQHGENHPVVLFLKEHGAVMVEPFARWSQSSAVNAHVASVLGDLKAIEKIVEQDANAIHERDQNGWQPIHEASRAGATHVVTFLVKHGADVNSKTFSGGTPLWYAGMQTGNPVVTILKENGAISNEPYTQAHQAARRGDVSKLEEIIINDEWAFEQEDKNGWRPLHEAVRSGRSEVVEFLIWWEVDVNAVTARGRTPLLMALEKLGEQHQISQLLRENGAAVLVDA